MIKKLASKKLLVTSTLSTLVMFVVVMFIVNPMVDQNNGLGVIQLQLIFDKNAAIQLIQTWGSHGVENFIHFIFADYLYALSYAFLFASLLATLIVKKAKEHDERFTWTIYLGFVAAMLDWTENTLELFFLHNPDSFSDTLFVFHSLVASLKWLILPVVVGYIILLIRKSQTPLSND